MYKLYWSPGAASMAPHAVLEDIGVPFDLILIDVNKGQQDDPDYRKLNPHGRVPTLIYDGGKVLYESAAITLFLTERHSEAQLAPQPGDPDRAIFLQWMAHLTNTVQEALMHYWHPERHIEEPEQQAALKQIAERQIAQRFQFLDGELAQRGPHLCGPKLYACHYFLVMLTRWTRLLTTPAHTYPNVNKLVRAVMTRPGYARMLAAEGIEQPV